MALPVLDPISVSAVLSAPDVTELTTGSVDGTGVFDVLMRSAKAHLIEEYNADRISGAEYTTVYLGAMTAVLQQSVTFILNHQHKEKISAEIGLIRQQTVTELTQTDDLVPAGLGFNDSTAIQGLVKTQKDLAAQKILSEIKQTALIDKQIEVADVQAQLTSQQIITEVAQTDDTLSSTAMTFALNGTNAIEGMIGIQRDKVDVEKTRVESEVKLTNQKIVTEIAQTDDTLSVAALVFALNGDANIEGLIGSQKAKTDAEVAFTNQRTVTELAQTDDTASSAGLVGSQRDKTDAEQFLLRLKGTTEIAQTMDAVPSLHSNGVLLPIGSEGTPYAVTGVIGEQKKLFDAQTKGFARDAEQKLSKMLLDTYSVRIGAGHEVVLPSTLDSAALDTVINKARVGIEIAQA